MGIETWTPSHEAVKALLSFSDAMSEGVTIADLIRVLGSALASGEKTLEIQLAMAMNALRMLDTAKRESTNGAK